MHSFIMSFLKKLYDIKIAEKLKWVIVILATKLCPTLLWLHAL